MQWYYHLKSRHNIKAIITLESNLQGYIARGGVLITQNEAYVHSIFVNPDHRGQGISKILMTEIMNFAKNHVGYIWLVVGSTNHVARHLYQSFGFEDTSSPHDDFTYDRNMSIGTEPVNRGITFTHYYNFYLYCQ